MMLSVFEGTLDDESLLRMAKVERVDDMLSAARVLLARPEQPTLTEVLLRELRERVHAARYPATEDREQSSGARAWIFTGTH